MPLSLSRPILYLITRGETTESTSAESPDFQDILIQISAAVAAGIDLIQIREKHLSARVLFELTEQAAEQVRGTQTRLLVNDRADIAAGAAAAGVHLTTQSLDALTIKRSFGDGLLIGVSTHSLVEACRARDQGAAFIVFGPVFPTSSKEQFGPPVGLEKLSEVARELDGFPVLALGGVSELNAVQCLNAGASGIAGISMFSESSRLNMVTGAIREAAKGIS